MIIKTGTQMTFHRKNLANAYFTLVLAYIVSSSILYTVASVIGIERVAVRIERYFW